MCEHMGDSPRYMGAAHFSPTDVIGINIKKTQTKSGMRVFFILVSLDETRCSISCRTHAHVREYIYIEIFVIFVILAMGSRNGKHLCWLWF